MSDKRLRNKGRSEEAEHFTKMIRVTMQTDAWRALSTTAQALYPWLKLEWRGPKANNNGTIRLSVRQAADRLGVTRDAAARAFQDLQAKGFTVQTEAACLGVAGAAKSPAYELTEIPLPHSDGHEGRKLYRQWRCGCDFPVQRAPANNPTGRNRKTKTPSRKPGQDRPENHDEPLKHVTKIGTARHANRDEIASIPGETVLKSGTSLSTRVGGPAGPRIEAPSACSVVERSPRRVGDIASDVIVPLRPGPDTPLKRQSKKLRAAVGGADTRASQGK